MSEVDDAMLQRMIHIVNEERKPFSYFDFLDLMKPKTYRNKISLLKKEGIVETDIRSPIAFHTLKGHKFGKPGTVDPTVVASTHPLYKTLRYLPFDKQAIHDIHATFQSAGIYKIFSDYKFPRIQTSEQIVVPSWRKGNTIVRIVISKTDTVSVTVGCSLEPIPLDFDGVIRFFTTLSSVWGLLAGLTYYQDYNHTTCFPVSLLSPTAVKCPIPEYQSWLITMWHFGRDALVEYTGKELSITTESAQHIVTRVYSKEWGNGTGRRKTRRIRQETQEYPNTTVEDAIEEKMELS
jgi:hypothetical protein